MSHYMWWTVYLNDSNRFSNIIEAEVPMKANVKGKYSCIRTDRLYRKRGRLMILVNNFLKRELFD